MPALVEYAKNDVHFKQGGLQRLEKIALDERSGRRKKVFHVREKGDRKVEVHGEREEKRRHERKKKESMSSKGEKGKRGEESAPSAAAPWEKKAMRVSPVERKLAPAAKGEKKGGSALARKDNFRED